jgi:hypothetical protein
MTRVRMVIASHINDAKYDTSDNLKNRRLNFILALLYKYPDTSVSISDEELEEMWYWIH